MQKKNPMKVLSYIDTNQDFVSVEVEVALVPGLSQIQVLGLPDKLITESSKRILSALTQQGFRLPPGQQIMVNLFPHHLAKSSKGLDLALAVAILAECRAINPDHYDFKKTHFYGALSLGGEVYAPDDIGNFENEKLQSPLITGRGAETQNFDFYEIQSLKDFPHSMTLRQGHKKQLWRRPSFDSELKFSTTMGHLMAVIAAGEHPTLLAGDAGAGKTTMAEAIAPLLAPPEDEVFFPMRKLWRKYGRSLTWRPVTEPHHSSSPIAMIGGRMPPRPGEITLAHTGVLILDELLEFHPQVQSALREPMEKGRIQVSRGGERRVFPAEALILATTNLCNCGRFHPQKRNRCGCSSQNLRRYLEKLSGPFLDRFAIFHLLNDPPPKSGDEKSTLSQEQIFEHVSQAHHFRTQRGQTQPNQKLTEPELLTMIDPNIDMEWIPHTSTRRRKNSLFRVARTIADLEGSPLIQRPHLDSASLWTCRDFYRLQDFGFECYF